VDSLHSKDSKNGTPAKSSPLSITIVTTDVALFCDTNAQAHTTAVERFVETVAPFPLDSIQIIVTTTASLGLQEEESEPKDNSNSNGEAVQAGGASAAQSHTNAVNHCIDTIQAKLDELECAVTARHGVGAKVGGAVSMTFAVIESSPVGFRFLSRQWVREALLEQRTAGRLRFDLPETMEGTQCSVSLETGYQIFPFSIESPQATMLLVDLRCLSSNMEVLQLVPLSSIDASLLFGVPISVRAGLESDYAQYQEMEALVRSLFKMLQDREQAIVLRAPSDAKPSNGLFGSSSTEQLFVLMAQEPPESLGETPTTGLLFRFAHADNLLAESSSAAGLNVLNGNTDLELQYSEYIEEALAGLTCSPFNPLNCISSALSPSSAVAEEELIAEDVQQAGVWGDLSSLLDHATVLYDQPKDSEVSQPQQDDDDTMSTDSHHSVEKQSSSVWNDAAGVGACAGPLDLSSTEDAAMLDDDRANSVFFD